MYSRKQLAQIVLPPDLATIDIGSRVAVRWPNNGKYYEATVVRERNKKKPFCVAYDNGQYEWIDFRHRKFRLLGREKLSRQNDTSHVANGSLSETGLSLKRYAIGTEVRKVSSVMYLKGCWTRSVAHLPHFLLKFFKGHGWFTGKVTSDDGECYRVIYEDGDVEECDNHDLEDIVLSPDLAKVEVGSRVAVLWPDDDTYYGATVTKERNDKKNSCCLEYDDGEREWVDLREHKFRLLEAAMRQREDEVEDDSDDDGDSGSELRSGDEIQDGNSIFGRVKRR